MKHPIQPIETDAHGVLRFKQNKIVKHLLETHTNCDRNTITAMGFDDNDRRQFAQLTGYSLSGYGDLSYVRDEDYSAAVYMHKNVLDEKDARIAALETTLAELRQNVRALRKSFEEVFDLAGDD